MFHSNYDTQYMSASMYCSCYFILFIDLNPFRQHPLVIIGAGILPEIITDIYLCVIRDIA